MYFLACYCIIFKRTWMHVLWIFKDFVYLNFSFEIFTIWNIFRQSESQMSLNHFLFPSDTSSFWIFPGGLNFCDRQNFVQSFRGCDFLEVFASHVVENCCWFVFFKFVNLSAPTSSLNVIVSNFDEVCEIWWLNYPISLLWSSVYEGWRRKGTGKQLIMG